MDTYFTLSYPSFDTIIDRVNEIGPGAHICKVDISKAFRQLRVDPNDIDLLGIKQDSYFLDVSIACGFTNDYGFFQRCTDPIRYIMADQAYPGLINYIDDLVHCDLPSKMHLAYECLIKLLNELCLPISEQKLIPPTTSMVCFGILVNTICRPISNPLKISRNYKYL